MSGCKQRVPDKAGGNPNLSSAPQKWTNAIAPFITEITMPSHLQGGLQCL